MFDSVFIGIAQIDWKIILPVLIRVKRVSDSIIDQHSEPEEREEAKR